MDYRGERSNAKNQEIPWRTISMESIITTRVVLAEDHERVRHGIRSLLEKTSDIEVVGEANNGLDAIRLVKELEPDVLLLDVEMPGLNGIEVARRLKSQGLSTRILVLSAYDDQEYILELLDHEVSGYLIKGEAPEHIVEAVRGVARDENGWVSPQVAMKLEKI
jgi:DNA-binding NarL/FixJ family response regulator